MKIQATLALMLVMASSGASAIQITTNTVQNSPFPPAGGGASFTTDYTITNDTNSSFTDLIIYFDLGLYENLSNAMGPVDWYAEAFETDGFVDGEFYLGTPNFVPFPLGGTLGGFSITYDYLIDALPGTQSFAAFDAFFDPAGGGSTTVVAAVPEPGTLALLGLGALAFGARSRRQARLALEEKSND